MANTLVNAGSVCCCSSSRALVNTNILKGQGNRKAHSEASNSIAARTIPCGCRTAASRVSVTSCASLASRNQLSSASSPFVEHKLLSHKLRLCSGSTASRQGTFHLLTAAAAAAAEPGLTDGTDVGASQDAVYSGIDVDGVAAPTVSEASVEPSVESEDIGMSESMAAEPLDCETLDVAAEAGEAAGAVEGNSGSNPSSIPSGKAAKFLRRKAGTAATDSSVTAPEGSVTAGADTGAITIEAESGYAVSVAASTPQAAAMSILDNERLAGTASLSQALLRRTSSQMSRSATAGMNPLIGRNALSRGGQSEGAIAAALLAATATVAGVVTLVRSRRLAASVLPIQIQSQECEDELCCVCDGDGKCACHFCGGSGNIVWEGKMLRKDPCPACVGEGHERCPSCGHTFKL